MEQKSNHTIENQAFWFSVINYLAIAIGVVSTFFLYPYDLDFIGKIGYIDSLAQMIFPFLVFGGTHTLIRYYPVLTNENRFQLFKYSSRTILFISFFIGLLLIFVDFFVSWDLYIYLYYSFFLAVAMAYIELLKRQAANLQRISVPAFYDKIIPKIALPLVLVLFLFKISSEENAIFLYLFFYAFLVFLLFSYIKKHFTVSRVGSFQKLFSQIEKKEYFKYSFYAFVGSFGSFLAFRLDGFMIPLFLDFEMGGIYKVGVNLASALAIPSVGLFTLYAPKVATYIEKGEWKELQNKYSETAAFLFFVGAFVLGGVVVGIESFFKLLPQTDKLLKALPIIYILGANVVVNMGTGFNSEIISYSNHYKFIMKAILVLVFVNIGLNYVVLTHTSMGLLGVALATFVSMSLFNVCKLLFIYKKMRIQPFTKKYIRLIVIQLTIILVVYSFPDLNNLWLNFFVREIAFVAFTILIVYKLKTVYLLNNWIDKIILYIQKR